MPATLFDELTDPLPKRPFEPIFWIRRVVFVEERIPTGRVIRSIPFRRGLNVVRVIDRPKGQVGPIGHSVGKTLLTRFIRYCLGEKFYAIEETTQQIARIYPDGYVIAEVVVTGVDWVVARPFAVGGALASHAGRSDCWEDALAPNQIREPFETFIESLSQSVVGKWPTLLLPRAKRNANWLDLLGWLSRDQECNFTHYNGWRSRDAHSGSKQHKREDASLIAAWGLGLIDPKEAEGRAAHQKLLTEREKAERLLRSETSVQAASRRLLNDRFPELSQEEDDDIFTQSAATQVETKVRQLQALREELEQAKSLVEMKKTAVELRKKHSEVNGRLERLGGHIQAKEGQLQTEEAARYNLVCHCPDKPSTCPVSAAKWVGAIAGQSTEVLVRLNQDLVDLRCRRDEVQAEVKAVSADLDAAESAYDNAEAKHRDSLRKLGEDIGRWEAHSEEVKAYSASRMRSRKAVRRVKKLNSEIERSERLLREGRQRQAQLLDQLSSLYGEVLTQLLGQETTAELQFDGRGIRLKPAADLRTNGLGMATLATVIGFDLMALRAIVEGLCPLPGFLIHDSPKASDLESALYDRVYEPILRMDPTNQKQEPAFQYIITTTTPPPPEVTDVPYVRETLHAMAIAGRLLRAEF